jgi:hypothetical protein
LRAMEHSREALSVVLGQAITADGYVKGFVQTPIGFLAYLIHDAHPRGQIAMLARQVGASPSAESHVRYVGMEFALTLGWSRRRFSMTKALGNMAEIRPWGFRMIRLQSICDPGACARLAYSTTRSPVADVRGGRPS